MSSTHSFSIHSTLAVLLIASIHSGALAESAPDGFGQLENAPENIPGGTDEEGRKYSYFGQKETGGKIILTASNGFFTKGTCQAKGDSSLPKIGDEDLIVPNFEYLDWKSAEGSLRWHLLISEPGMVHFNVHLDSADSGTGIVVEFAGQTKKVSSSKSGADKAQPWDLSFDIKEAGEYLLALKSADPESSGKIGQLHRIDAFGPGISGGHLLRVRWRPAAAHGGYDTSKVPDSKLLVFTTRSTASISSYSPITTPFGYYGTSFDGDRRSNGSFNFSMWGKEDAASDIKLMPHLLGIGSPDGEFSGFGHEGSGVKPRGWDPMPDRPELVVQALRLVPGDEYDSYFGYYFDHPTKAWKFYGGGKKWHGGRSNSHLKLGSFCEVPGPPHVERTGDVIREVRRKGWSYDKGNWVFLEKYNPGGAGSSGDVPVNKSWYTSNEGEYVMGCGGIRLYQHSDALIKTGESKELPYFLASPSIANVFTMPIAYGKIQATEISSNRALIEVDIPEGGELKDGTVYFGTKDALTFAPRELHGTEKNSSLSQTINNMSWQKSAGLENPAQGVNQIELSDLEPETTYYYRVISVNDVSQVWNNETLSFKTPKAGASATKLPPLVAAKGSVKPKVAPTSTKQLENEPFRIWSYSVGNKTQKIEGRLTGIAGGKVQIERKSDGKKGTMDLSLFSEEDRAYVNGLP